MKILLCHNYYQQVGGEDRVYADEIALLESYGHEVHRYSVHNDVIGDGTRQKLQLAKSTIWNSELAKEISDLVRQRNIRVVHFHNTFPLISPAAYAAARDAGAAVVQSLHNYRLLCPRADFIRDGQICEQCLGKTFPWPSVVHSCYRGSREITAVVASMLATHRVLGTFKRCIDRFIALTPFSQSKFAEGGLPPEKIRVKMNFVAPTPEVGTGRGGYGFYLGRLTPEKGISTMLEAWSKLDDSRVLRIAGKGPDANLVRAAVERRKNVEYVGGDRTNKEIHQLLADAAFLVLPTLNYEGCPKEIIEAYAAGTPVLASRIGAIQDLVADDHTGCHVELGSVDDLATKAEELFGDPQRLNRMRTAARSLFEREFTAEANYHQLMGIYDEALRHRHGPSRPTTANSQASIPPARTESAAVVHRI